MSEETQSFPKPLKKLRQLGVQVCSQFFFYYLHFDCTNELKTAVVWKRSSSVVLQNMAIISTAKVWVLNIRRLQIHSIFLFLLK